ncbi:MAG: hypothetical protein KU37_11865 [Sulfuricurvum sp. PC08-66]|nr:MAG: hypothetical protein KU37_11865 [Sulfuricurvum sp. PC08-66]
MDYVTLGAVVAGVIVVGFLIKQIKLFLLLALLVGGGLWFFVLDENQKENITQSVKENQTLNELKEEATQTLDEVKEKAVEEGKELADKAIEEIKEGVDTAKEQVKIPTH